MHIENKSLNNHAAKADTKQKKIKTSYVKTVFNYTTAATALGILMQSTSRHHIEHAALHSFLGPIVIKSLIEPATKLLGAKMTEPACHTNPIKPKTTKEDTKKPTNKSLLTSANDYVNGLYFGMVTHLATQILFDEANKLFNLPHQSHCH
jgi:hypothetical protein